MAEDIQCNYKTQFNVTSQKQKISALITLIKNVAQKLCIKMLKLKFSTKAKTGCSFVCSDTEDTYSDIL